MNLLDAAVALLIKITFAITLANGLYIRNSANSKINKIAANNVHVNKDDEWNLFKQKLGLSNKKVELLKSQKDQRGTLDLLKRFIEENPKYDVNKQQETSEKISDDFVKVYHNLLKQLKLSRRTLKTSLNLEFAEKPHKNLKRSRRRIAVKMVSDMPSDKIDELVKMFNEKNGIGKLDVDDDSAHSDDSDTENDYIDFPTSLSPAMDPDYVYENLYEDEGDLAVPAKSNRNSQYGSFQDLILQASRNQWQREIEETKLRSRDNQHFI